MTGRLLGIARKSRPKAAVEEIASVVIGLDHGVEGDHRGRIKPGGRGRRQVTAMSLADWRAALAECGDPPLRWSDRRANLLIDGELPREKGACLRIGEAVFQITGECDPCRRMDALAPGLEAALAPGWRGGRTMRVIRSGRVAVGDPVLHEIQETP